MTNGYHKPKGTPHKKPKATKRKAVVPAGKGVGGQKPAPAK